jgi:heat shock protein HslJ
MKKLTVLFGLALILCVLAGGCTTQAPAKPVLPTTAPTILPPTTPTPTPAPTASFGFYREWILTTMAIQNGRTLLVPTTEITLVFNPDGNLTGYSGCNNYFASYTLTGAMTEFGNGIRVGPIASTKKYCEIYGPQEATYLQVLQDTKAYTVNLNQLSLTDKDQNVLVFRVPSAVPTTAYYPNPA